MSYNGNPGEGPPQQVIPILSEQADGFYQGRILGTPGSGFDGQIFRLPRIDHAYVAVTRISYSVLPAAGAGVPATTPPHPIRLAWQDVPEDDVDANASRDTALRFPLADSDDLNFVTIESDGYWGIQPPYVDGGITPYALAIWSDTADVTPGLPILVVQWRFHPRRSGGVHQLGGC